MSISDLKIPDELSQWITKILLGIVIYFLLDIHASIKEIEKIKINQIGIQKDMEIGKAEREALKKFTIDKFAEYNNRLAENENWKMQLFRDYELRRR